MVYAFWAYFIKCLGNFYLDINKAFDIKIRCTTFKGSALLSGCGTHNRSKLSKNFFLVTNVLGS